MLPSAGQDQLLCHDRDSSTYLLLPARFWQGFSLEDGTSNCRAQGPRDGNHKVPQWVMGKMVSGAVLLPPLGPGQAFTCVLNPALYRAL